MKKNKKILVTGANGFVGSHMLDYLLSKKNNDIYGLIKINAQKRNIKHLINKIKFIEGDISDKVSIDSIIQKLKPDHIYHFAALSWVSPSWNMPIAYFNVNALGTINLLESVRKYNINSKILISCTPEEFGDVKKKNLPINEETLVAPVNHYAASKVAQDAICQSYFASYNMKIIRCRAFNHEGPRRDINGAISSFAYQISRIENEIQKTPIEVGNLNAVRNFTHVSDMVRAYYLALNKGKPGELYLIGSDLIFSMKQILQKLIKLSNKKIKYKVVKSRIRPTELNYLIGDITKFKKLTKWKYRKNINDILLDTLNYWRDFIKNKYY